MPLVQIALLLLGLFLVAIGGDLFVRGALCVSHWARVSPAVIGATVAAFATSSPELTVAINAALSRTPQIALGDALGSNVVNIAVILGMAALFFPVKNDAHRTRREFVFALIAPLLTALLLLNGNLSRADAVVMLGLFSLWFAWLLVVARRQRVSFAATDPSLKPTTVTIQTAAGLALLVGGGILIVSGAQGVATFYGVAPFLIGVTLVALGTSAPEIATVIISKLRGHEELGVGALLGSNIFNGLFIVGVAALIHPIAVAWNDVALALAVGTIAVVVAMPLSARRIGRHRGIALLSLYLAYMTLLYRVNAN